MVHAKEAAACDRATSSFNLDEDNVTAMSREFARFNPIIARCVEYMLDLIDAQIEFGASQGYASKMADEVEELTSLIADSFSCGNPYLDSVANSNVPVRLPDNHVELLKHIATIRRLP